MAEPKRLVDIQLEMLNAFRSDWIGFAVTTVAFLIFVVIAVREFRQKLFPFVRILFRDRKSIKWPPELMISVLTLAATVIGIVVAIVK
jgi:hypothetical protein